MAVQAGTLIILGKTSQQQLDEAISEGLLTQADVNLARDRFLSISNNLQGMSINRKEWDISIKGLDKVIVDSLLEFTQNPAARALVAKTPNQS